MNTGIVAFTMALERKHISSHAPRYPIFGIQGNNNKLKRILKLA